ncbi:MAG: HD domain-containing protein, partial [Elusimicrobia bacterium]|nr:HD domain-containing protein [Elusimicrobiota bacterium]
DKYIGDGLMAEFGMPYPCQQNTLLAVLAALKMQQSLARKNFQWKMRIGIAHGNALVGLVGSDRRKNYSALGDTVNLAARLQQMCPVGGVCIDGSTYEKVNKWFHTRRLFAGWSPEEVESLEGRLRTLKDLIHKGNPPEDVLLEAGRLSTELGDSSQAIQYYRKALQLNPSHREAIEGCVAQAALQSDEKGHVDVKGKVQRVSAFEVLGLKDPMDDPQRIPPAYVSRLNMMLSAEELDRDRLLTIEALDGSIGHSQSTAALSVALADALKLSEEEQRIVFLAGFFHDAGKKNVPDHLLNQDERVTNLPENQDLRMIQSHVEAARPVLADLGVRLPEEALKAIDQHHEKFDGSGYPQGLKGEQISIAARILQVADVYDSITAGRPYRDSWDPGAALNEIRQEAEMGILDPSITDAFCEMIRSGIKREL